MKLEKVDLGSGRIEPDLDSKKKDGIKPPRLPRWTRQELLVLIEGKRVSENQAGRGRVSGSGGSVEPKWASVSSYCKRYGVNRAPVQCRKRWSNLAGDYKKIKEWESQIRDESESFWTMRNDLRRERKLPGFFDKEVYDILEGGNGVPAEALTFVSPVSTGLALALVQCSTLSEEEGDDVATAEEEEADGVFFDSGRSAAAGNDGMFSDSEGLMEEESPSLKEHNPTTDEIPALVPISCDSEQQYQLSNKGPSSEGATGGEQGNFNPEMDNTSSKGRKRKRSPSADVDNEDTKTLHHQLIGVLEKNGEMLSAYLESQNTNFRLDREQRKDHMDSLVAVLGKLADALGRIADKL